MELAEIKDNYLMPEQLFIGCLLTEPDKILSTIVTADHLLDQAHRTAYETIKKMVHDNKPVDIFGVAQGMEEASGMGTNYLPYLSKLVELGFTKAFIATAEDQLVKAFRKRTVDMIVNTHLKNYDTDKAIHALMALDDDQRHEIYLPSQCAEQANEAMEKAKSTNGLVGLPTGIDKLDNYIGGFQDPDFIVIAARPAMGKTSVAVNFMLNHQVPVGFFSTEQPAAQIGLKQLSMKSNIPVQQLRTGKITGNQIDNYVAGLDKVSKGNIFVYDKGSLTISELVTQARRMKYQYGVQAIYVDYIQRMTTEGDRREGIGDICRGLKSLAKELEIPVVALAQVNRNVESRTDKRPNMGDIKDSGDIEQEADNIIILYRDEVYNQDSMDGGVMEIALEKNRHGPTGMVKVAWLSQTTQIGNLDQTYEQY